MKFLIEQQKILKVMHPIANVAERKQVSPILSHAYLRLNGDSLLVVANDRETQIEVTVDVDQMLEEGEITVPAKKFLEIIRTFSENKMIQCTLKNNKFLIVCDRSRFELQTLPAQDYPLMKEESELKRARLPQSILKKLFECTAFSMAVQDFRFYLNGLLLESNAKEVFALCTDGHRLSKMVATVIDSQVPAFRILIPRKSVYEILKLIEDKDEFIEMSIGSNHFKVMFPNICFTSKVLNSEFPDCSGLIPRVDIMSVAPTTPFKQALLRAQVMATDNHRVTLVWSEGFLKISSVSKEEEIAEEELSIDYHGKDIELHFNVQYLLEVLNVINDDFVRMGFDRDCKTALIESSVSADAKYIVMPLMG